MAAAQMLLDEYGESHQNPTNKLIHWICVPVIYWSTVGLIWSIPAGPLEGLLSGSAAAYANWASVGAILSLLWFFKMSINLGIGLTLWSALMLFLCERVEALSSVPLYQLSLVLFLVAWAGQFIGHKIEGKKPSFLKDLQFLLVGPMWLMHFVYRKLGIAY
jgi:uncharacterized membrane protein YGL010W